MSDTVWLSADVPADIAERFRARAREESRSGAAHLRYIIREYVLNDREPGGQPDSRNSSGVETAGHESG